MNNYEIDALRHSVVSKVQRITDLESELAQAQKQIGILNATVASREWDASYAERTRDTARQRLNEIYRVQMGMRDPERKMVCDILANGKTDQAPHEDSCPKGDAGLDKAEMPEEAKMMTFETDYEILQDVVRAMEGTLGFDQEHIAYIGVEWVSMLLKKNRDYGDNIWESPTLVPGMDCGTAILTRMSDKISRLRSLSVKTTSWIEDEKFEDTIADLAGYCLLYLARPDHLDEGEAASDEPLPVF